MDIRIEPATVSGKDVRHLKRGDVFQPNSRLAYCVGFRLEDGDSVLLEVPEARFDDFSLGDAGELAWQDYMILSFGDMRFLTYP